MCKKGWARVASKFEMKPERWTVLKGKFLWGEPVSKLSYRCNHRKVGACGGCYARMLVLAQVCKKYPNHTVHLTDEVWEAMNAEEAARKLGAGKK